MLFRSQGEVCGPRQEFVFICCVSTKLWLCRHVARWVGGLTVAPPGAHTGLDRPASLSPGPQVFSSPAAVVSVALSLRSGMGGPLGGGGCGPGVQLVGGSSQAGGPVVSAAFGRGGREVGKELAGPPTLGVGQTPGSAAVSSPALVFPCVVASRVFWSDFEFL